MAEEHKFPIFKTVTDILCGNVEKVASEWLVPLRHQTKHMARIFEALVDRLYLEPNTGLPNYQSFTKTLNTVIDERRALRKNADGTPMPHDTVVFLDMNHFKQFNTRLNSGPTDCLIKEIAHLLKNHLREHQSVSPFKQRHDDLLARPKMGGDEFMILMRNCDEKNAKLKVKALLADIAKKAFIVPGALSKANPSLVRNITFSYGCYELDSEMSHDNTSDRPHSAIYKAEKRMQAYKDKGKQQALITPPAIRTGSLVAINEFVQSTGIDKNNIVNVPEPERSLAVA